jgi:hypothetical protein
MIPTATALSTGIYYRYRRIEALGKPHAEPGAQFGRQNLLQKN